MAKVSEDVFKEAIWVSKENALRNSCIKLLGFFYFLFCSRSFWTLGGLFSTGLSKQHFICRERSFGGGLLFSLLNVIASVEDNFRRFGQKCSIRLSAFQSRCHDEYVPGMNCWVEFIYFSLSLGFCKKIFIVWRKLVAWVLKSTYFLCRGLFWLVNFDS